MTTLNAFFHPRLARIRRYLRTGPEQQAKPAPMVTPGSAPAHKPLRTAPEVPEPRTKVPPTRLHHPAWLDTGGRVDRLRRNERHGDEKE